MRELTILADGAPFVSECRFHLSGSVSVGLFPSLFNLKAWNLPEKEYHRLASAKELIVLHNGSCLAAGRVWDVYRETASEGTVTALAFSLGLDLWESPVYLTVEAGVSVSETVRRILAASGTGIQILSFPGEDPVFPRGQAFCGRAAECIEEALSAAGARAFLVPAGLKILPKDPLPAALHLTEKDLTDKPSFAQGGGRMILSTTVTGFQPGEEVTVSYGGCTAAGLILERRVEADTSAGPWSTQLLAEVHRV